MGIEPVAKRRRHGLAGFLWGLAEGTFFFVVPDVYISRAALFWCRDFIACTFWALAGSLCAGLVMYALSVHYPAAMESFVRQVPFIPDAMLTTVREQYAQQGVWTLVNG
ncbi:MAG TPA: hypothetical protein VEF76_14410, partial [Patescibacteria group bacterium]|nr:hypothetical protein [Patescibacteria group bacterium]